MAAAKSRPGQQSVAVILRLQPVAESDLIAVLLSPKQGKIEAYARAARKSTKRFGGRLEPFVEGVATLGKGRGSLATLQAFEPQIRHLGTAVEYEQLALASYFAELAITAAQPEHEDTLLFSWLRSAVAAAALADASEWAATKLAADIAWLSVMGGLADPMTCVECGSATDSGAQWTTATPGPICEGCSAATQPNANPAVLRVIAELGQGVVTHSLAARLKSADGGKIEAAIGARVAELLPRPPKSLRGFEGQFSLDCPA